MTRTAASKLVRSPAIPLDTIQTESALESTLLRPEHCAPGIPISTPGFLALFPILLVYFFLAFLVTPHHIPTAIPPFPRYRLAFSSFWSFLVGLLICLLSIPVYARRIYPLPTLPGLACLAVLPAIHPSPSTMVYLRLYSIHACERLYLVAVR